MSQKYFFAKNFVLLMAVFVMSLTVASCGSVKHTAKPSTTVSASKTKRSAPAKKTAQTKPVSKPPQHIDFSSAANNSVAGKLLREADSWMGTPYIWGGNDRNGVDCSGFVTQVYLRSLEISLPRTSEQQQKYCTLIERDELQPGDLVFFTVRGGDRVGHVGIYIGNGNMVHSSSSKGVIITSLDNPYFVSNYHSAGRVERYYAMMKSGVKNKPTDSPAPKTMASAKTSTTPVTKSDTKPAARPTAKPAAKPVVKPVEKPAAPQKISTPLPSQVFASATSTDNSKTSRPDPVQEPDAEEPDFFD